MKAKNFDFVRFRDFRSEREDRVSDFLNGKSRSNVFLKEVAFKDFYSCKNREESLELQLDAISQQMALSSMNIPYLEPWFGVGVYANAFGAEYIWPAEGLKESPQTHYVAFNEEDIENLPDPDVSKAPIMSMIIDAIDYFIEETKGEVPVCVTDTQSPIDNATLVWDTSSFFLSLCTNPDLVHKFLRRITDLTIEFTDEQIRHLGDVWTRPGHIMMSSTAGPGISLSDDNIVMLSPEHYRDFAVRYNEVIAERYGGLAIHSCGNYRNQLDALLSTKGLFMIDGAFSLQCDPSPNSDLEYFREKLKDSGVILQARMGDDWEEMFPKVYHPDIKIALALPAPAENEPKDKNITRLNRMLDSLN
ncbi:MAG: hypothetical protein JW808_07800 [Victivallales bacterium]|nr:hypothetical protein [Victivallales bacterium]